MSVAEAAPDYEIGTDGGPRIPRPSQGPWLSRLHRGVRALLLLFHADAARALHGQLPADARPDGTCDRPRLAAGARLSRNFRPAARLGDFRNLHRARLRTPIVGGIIADKWLGRDTTLIIGGVLMAIGHFLMAIQSAFVFALLALVLGVGAFKGNIATPGRSALRPERSAPRNGVPDLLHLHQRQRDRRAADLRHAGPEGGLALRLRLRRRGDGDRAHHLSVGPTIPARASELAGPSEDPALREPLSAIGLAMRALPRDPHPGPGHLAAHQPGDLQRLSHLGRSAFQPDAVRLRSSRAAGSITIDAAVSFAMLVAVAAFWKWWGTQADASRTRSAR